MLLSSKLLMDCSLRCQLTDQTRGRGGTKGVDSCTSSPVPALFILVIHYYSYYIHFTCLYLSLGLSCSSAQCSLLPPSLPPLNPRLPVASLI